MSGTHPLLNKKEREQARTYITEIEVGAEDGGGGWRWKKQEQRYIIMCKKRGKMEAKQLSNVNSRLC